MGKSRATRRVQDDIYNRQQDEEEVELVPPAREVSPAVRNQLQQCLQKERGDRTRSLPCAASRPQVWFIS